MKHLIQTNYTPQSSEERVTKEILELMRKFYSQNPGCIIRFENLNDSYENVHDLRQQQNSPTRTQDLADAVAQLQKHLGLYSPTTNH